MRSIDRFFYEIDGIGDVIKRFSDFQAVSYHDCGSLAAAWELGVPSVSVDPSRPTGASQAQSPGEEDPGDGKENFLIQSCPAFR